VRSGIRGSPQRSTECVSCGIRPGFSWRCRFWNAVFDIRAQAVATSDVRRYIRTTRTSAFGSNRATKERSRLPLDTCNHAMCKLDIALQPHLSYTNRNVGLLCHPVTVTCRGTATSMVCYFSRRAETYERTVHASCEGGMENVHSYSSLCLISRAWNST
jgi:hypothetical protein